MENFLASKLYKITFVQPFVHNRPPVLSNTRFLWPGQHTASMPPVGASCTTARHPGGAVETVFKANPSAYTTSQHQSPADYTFCEATRRTRRTAEPSPIPLLDPDSDVSGPPQNCESCPLFCISALTLMLDSQWSCRHPWSASPHQLQKAKGSFKKNWRSKPRTCCKPD